ncbi:MAG: phosphoenolpyruvate--protein phosphotransferase [Verrucomicrobiota bacterium]|nr:phosphoenolpyruvate--protein phosphotransferase [Verrucomicrobiota bacterium]
MNSEIKRIVLDGIKVSDGVVIGEVYVMGSSVSRVPEREIEDSQIEDEIKRFKKALKKTKAQIKKLQDQVYSSLGKNHADIFEAHLMLVDDNIVLEEVLQILRSENQNIDFIFDQVVKRYIEAIRMVDDAYFKDRIADIRDVANRILVNMSGEKVEDLKALKGKKIIIAHDISPFVAASMDKKNIIGFGTDVGSKTSHTAIIARSMKIPAVVGLHSAVKHVKTGDMVILDGVSGKLILSPTKEDLDEYELKEIRQDRKLEKLKAQAHFPTETLDGFRVQLAGNIEHPDDTENLKEFPNTGIGLYRTEYLFLGGDDFPSEEEQFEAYKSVAESIAPNAVIIRTIDIGGDKLPSKKSDLFDSENPFLGVRAIRLCLIQKELFKKQLRAILRASHYGKVRLMFPMICAVEELLEAVDILEEAKNELRNEKIPFNNELDIGIMIEVPSAALIADQLAQYVDFFSIGTNDLIQYLMAVDRVNENIAYLYQPTHPSLIRLIRHVVNVAQSEGIWVGICGEVAGDPILTPLVLGLGIHELSMSSVAIPEVKNVIRALNMHDAEQLVEDAMKCRSGPEVRMLCEAFVNQLQVDIN